MKQSVLNVLRKIAVLSNQNLFRNTQCLLAKEDLIAIKTVYGWIIWKTYVCLKNFLSYWYLKASEKKFNKNDNKDCNITQFLIKTAQFLNNGCWCLYFCSHFYDAFKKEKMIVGPVITRSPNLKEVILCCKFCITNVLSTFSGLSKVFDNECFRKLNKLLIQNYQAVTKFDYFVKSKVWFFQRN